VPSGTRATTRPGDSTRARLVRTAERLFARHGIDAVSLNEIVHAAKVSSAAIHYHFGSREGLIEAIVEARQPAWETLARDMLAALEGKADVTPREVVAVMVEPIVALKSDPWGDDYLRMLSDLAGHRRHAAILYRLAEPYTQAYLKQLARVTPALPDDVRIARYAHLRAFVFHAVAASDERVEMWLTSIGQSATGWTTRDFIDLLTGAMTAPMSNIE
jgi:AcrR family transcriptional regulator